jgi:hypothetical protein
MSRQTVLDVEIRSERNVLQVNVDLLSVRPRV